MSNVTVSSAIDSFLQSASSAAARSSLGLAIGTDVQAYSAGLGAYSGIAVASGSAVGLTSGTSANVTSLSLVAGDWDVEGNINYAATSATITARKSGLSTTSATMPADGSEVHSGVQSTTLTATDGTTLPRKRLSLGSTTTVYLVAQGTFSAGSVAAYGTLTARRMS